MTCRVEEEKELSAEVKNDMQSREGEKAIRREEGAILRRKV